MSRSIRMFGVPILSSLAAVASLASAAQASSFMSEGNVTAAISANQVLHHTFFIEGNRVECAFAHFAAEGEVSSPSETVTVHPTYSGCEAFGFVEATVSTTGCNYVLSASGFVEIACSGLSPITITASTCQATVGSQLLLGMSYRNLAGGWLDVEAEVLGITVTKTKDGFLCPFSGTGTAVGRYEGLSEAEGRHSGSHMAITVE